MHSTEFQRFGLLKLTPGNYHTWKHKTEMILVREKLWHTVSCSPPSDRTPDWLEKDEQARACIGLLVDDRFLVDVRGQPDANTTWKHLGRLYGQNNMQMRMSLNKSLFTAKYRHGGDMSEHLASMMEIADKLSDLGHPLDETLLCTAVLCSLPTDYSTLITTIEANSDASLSIEMVRSKIMEEAYRKKTQKGDHPNTTHALTVTNRARGTPGFTRSTCFYCNKVGHLKKDCRLRKRHEAHTGLEDTSKFNNHKPNYSQRSEHSKTVTKSDDCQTIDSTDVKQNPPDNRTRVMTISYPKLTPANQGWIIDSGACEHLCKTPELLTDFHPTDSGPTFFSADGSQIATTGVGEYEMPIISETGNRTTLKLSPVYCLPTITDNLLAIRTLDKEGYTSSFKAGKAYLLKDNISYLIGESRDKLYWTIEEPIEQTRLCTHQWHNTLGHTNTYGLRRTMEQADSLDLQVEPCHPDPRCETCLLAKLANKPFKPRRLPNSSKAFDMIHSDICGPISPKSLGGNRYVLTLIDDYSKYGKVYIIKHKGEAAQHIISYLERNVNRFGRTPTRYRTDCGGEFKSKRLERYLKLRGIKHETSVPHTPQENGQAERFNRTLFDSVRSIIQQSSLPKHLWGEIAHTANYLNNLILRSKQTKTPFELWFNKKPEYSHLHTVGTHCVYLNTSPTKRKLDNRGKEGILLGFGESKHIYRVLDPKSGKVILSRRVVFKDQKCHHCKDSNSSHETELPPMVQGDTTLTDTSQSTTTPDTLVRRSTRTTHGIAPKILTYDQQGQPHDEAAERFQKYELNNYSS